MAEKKTFKTAETREHYIKIISDFLAAQDEDVKRVSSTAIAFPVTDADGNEGCVKLVISVPKGSREGEPYDVYQEAEDYAYEQAEKAEKKRKEAEKREKKKAADAAAREEKRKLREQKKAEREAAKAEVEEEE